MIYIHDWTDFGVPMMAHLPVYAAPHVPTEPPKRGHCVGTLLINHSPLSHALIENKHELDLDRYCIRVFPGYDPSLPVLIDTNGTEYRAQQLVNLLSLCVSNATCASAGLQRAS